MDPVDPFFDSGAWMEAYAARQGRAGQQGGSASQQGDFERRMEDLQLDSPDESSAKSSSPDQTPAGAGRAVRRDELGGSMRVPPRSDFRDSARGDARRSLDIPRFQLDAPAQVPQSGLRDDLFSSARYSLPDAEPVVQARSAKSRGLWSRFKSEIGKAFGGSSKSSREAAQPDASSTSFRVDYARQPGRTRGVDPEDEALIKEFRQRAVRNRTDGTAASNLTDGTIRNAAADLRILSARLNDNDRPSIADRIRLEMENAQLEDPEVENRQLEAELDQDVDTYAADRARRIKAALKKLREVWAGNTLSADLRRLAPHGTDATLIGRWAAAEKATRRVEPETIDRQARRMSRLSEWLRTHDKQAIAGRLFTSGLDQDVAEYRQETDDGKIKADLLRLGRYQQILEANRALGLHPAEDAGQPVAEGARRAYSPQEVPATPATPSAGAWDWLGEQIHGPSSSLPVPHHGWQASSSQQLPATSASPSAGAWDRSSEQILQPAAPVQAPYWIPQSNLPHGLPATPASLSQGAWDWFGQQMQEPASPSSVRPRSSNIYSGLDPLVDLDPSTPHDLHDDARSAPVPEFRRAPSFAGPSGGAQELRDIGAVVGSDWRHGSQAASDVLVDVLGNINLLPNQFGPSQFMINGERYSATFGPGGRTDVRLIHHPRPSYLDEAGPSRPLHHPPQIVQAEQPREGLRDLGYLIRGGWEHRERFLPPYLVRVLQGERIMPQAGRPTYFQIRGVSYRGELDESEGRQRVRIYPERG
ncbi:hypothetical protein [Bradyrhizobium sp. CCBAU 53421]|uniref:hypothetical protein n=1 Tax=Bradyrhizobium sp. CCBAU 53421 TaxID=1325120 RepID=UPI00188A083B|nr:hypothetical protein [Bradyrhizobium sp. CCBAU 53421]QOZ36299.1 hypothetical protein XH92_35415 [Bradyrhizobium sp. CCBAU 53421]